jgi:hypothetical protein
MAARNVWPLDHGLHAGKGKMEVQLVAGQWVEVSMEDLQTPILLNGFVLRQRPSEILLTFPELLAPPDGLEAEAHALVRYSNSSGGFAAMGRIIRVASGPPVTVTFKRLVPVDASPRRAAADDLATIPAALHIVRSCVAPLSGPDGVEGTVQNLTDRTIFLQTSLLLAVGDTLRVEIGNGARSTAVHGRVIRVERDRTGIEGFGVGVELVHETDDEHQRWLALVEHWQQAGAK